MGALPQSVRLSPSRTPRIPCGERRDLDYIARIAVYPLHLSRVVKRRRSHDALEIACRSHSRRTTSPCGSPQPGLRRMRVLGLLSPSPGGTLTDPSTHILIQARPEPASVRPPLTMLMDPRRWACRRSLYVGSSAAVMSMAILAFHTVRSLVPSSATLWHPFSRSGATRGPG